MVAISHKTSWFKTAGVYISIVLSIWTVGKGAVTGIAEIEKLLVEFRSGQIANNKQMEALVTKTDKISDKTDKIDNKVDKLGDKTDQNTVDVAILKTIISQRPKVIYIHDAKKDNTGIASF